MWNLKYNTNETIYETEADSHTENRLVVPDREGGDGMEGEAGVSGCKQRG